MDVLKRAILMGDPTHFHIAGGSNPFTRTWWGRKKHVDQAKAVAQWHGLARRLIELGVAVFVIPPDPLHPGLVYPANYGVRLGTRFLLSNLLPTRAGERPIYAAFLKGMGLPTASIRRRFEGEAEFFPVGSRWIFTYGAVTPQKFVPKLTIPPWTRVYGFRTERASLEELRLLAPQIEIVDFELIEESHYHGDTVFCSFGPNREHLLMYPDGLAPESRERCRHLFKDRLIELSSWDAFHYAANSFQVETPEGLKLVMPEGVSAELLKNVRGRGVEPVTIDVSEFLKKGGGSVKCMIGDLGILPPPPSLEANKFREHHRYRSPISAL